MASDRDHQSSPVARGRGTAESGGGGGSRRDGGLEGARKDPEPVEIAAAVAPSTASRSPSPASQGRIDDLERGPVLTPRFGPDGLIAAVATHAQTGEVLMLAWMNAQALALTLEHGEAHYWSRSRGELWRKGASSGQVQRLVEARIDCDQDAVWLKVLPQGDGGACHVGFRSCFYRVIEHGVLVERP